MSSILKRPCQFSGTGIHSGHRASIRCSPSDRPGIRFIRTDCGNQEIPVSPNSIDAARRATILSENGIKINTPEHILSAAYGLDISYLDIAVDSEEIPIMDGSSLPFLNGFLESGLERAASLPHLVISKTIRIGNDDAWLEVHPSTDFKVSYTLSYPDSFIGTQTHTEVVTPNSYQSEIAPARTYGFYREVQELISQGLAKGGSIENAVIIGEEDYMTQLRFENELVRHKILDIIGDFALLGRPIQAHIIGYKSGHALNCQMVQTLSQES